MGTSLVLLCAALLPVAATAQDLRSDTAVIRVLVPANYNDNPELVRRVKRLAASLPPKEVEQTRSRHIAELIQQYYDVSIGPKARAKGTSLPATYAAIADVVRDLNGLSRTASVVPSGKVLLPALPQKALTEWNRALGRNYVPQVVRAKVVVARNRQGETQLALHDIRLISGVTRAASQLRIVEMKVPSSLLRETVAQLEPLFASGDAELVAEPMSVTFIDLGDGQFDNLTPVGELTSIQEYFRGKQIQARTRLLILDSGWPDDDSYRYSRARLRELIDSAGRRWGITTASVGRRPDAQFTPPNFAHVNAIASALQPYLNAVPDAVDVIYVPMSLEQDARSVLSELLQFDALLSRKLLRLRKSNPRGDALLSNCGWSANNIRTYSKCARLLPLSQDDQNAAASYAASVLADLPAAFPSPAPATSFRSSSAIVAAVWSLATVLNADENTGSIMNASWTLAPLLAEFAPDSRMGRSVLMVAAAGNAAGLIANADTSTVDYAARSTTNANVLAVMNLSTTGEFYWHNGVCKSSILDPERLNGANVVAYDGRLTTRMCGTSFAAPRISWIIAVDNSFRMTPMNLINWTADVRARLTCSRAAHTLAGVQMNPVAFFRTTIPCN